MSCLGSVAALAGVPTMATRLPRLSGDDLKTCGYVRGAHYSYSAPGGAKLSGTRYNVVAGGISCASAERYASRDSYDVPKVFVATYDLSLLYGASGIKFAGWPPHFICAGASYSLTRHKAPTTSGFCWSGSLDPLSSKTTALIEWTARPN